MHAGVVCHAVDRLRSHQVFSLMRDRVLLALRRVHAVTNVHRAYLFDTAVPHEHGNGLTVIILLVDEGKQRKRGE